MISKKFGGRIKAAVLSAVMTATVFVSPAAYQLTQVTAAGSVSIGKTLIATKDDSSTSTRATRFSMKNFGTDCKSVTLNFETTYDKEVTVGIGYNLKDEPYWEQADGVKGTPKDGKLSITYTFPTSVLSDVNFTSGEMEAAIWWPASGEEFTLVSATTDGSTTSNPVGPQDKPETQNTKSGSWSFKDLGNGKALISSTLTAEIDDQKMDYLLTAKHDEESYLDPETGESTWEEGMPINSHKFKFSDFGLDDLTSVDIQSFNYTVKSDKDMKKFMYGGGINVGLDSPADTEKVKGKNGYWYNDQGEEDMKEYGDLFQVKVNNGYTVENAGNYVEVVWDVPADVQPYVSNEPSDTVGFQFWYAEDANPPEGEDYAEVTEVHLTSASCTYTRTLEVPYNTTVNKKVGKTLVPGSDEATNQYKYSLSELGLENRDLVSAIKFNVSSTADLTKFVGGVGISVANANPSAPNGWYMPEGQNITVLDAGNKFEIMWLVPEKIRKDIDILSGDGNVLFGAWYTGEDAPEITLDSIDFYELVSNEDDLTVAPQNIELTVGETKKLTINVDGCTFTSANPKVATAANDVVTAVGEGLTKITVTTPEGQETVITVKVNPAPVTTVVTTAVTTVSTTVKTTVKTTTKPVTTTVPATTTTVTTEEPIDWGRVLYGDVNLDTNITVADTVLLNKFLISGEDEVKLSSTAKENAQCVYDGVIDAKDSTLLVNYNAMLVKVEELGPQAGQSVPFVPSEQ